MPAEYAHCTTLGSRYNVPIEFGLENGNKMKTPLIGSILIAAGSMGALGTAAAAEWQVAKETSAVSFVGVQQGTKFTGRFQDFTAAINFDPSEPDSGSIVGVVMTASVKTRDHDRDATLLDGDWFDSNTYPEATFESQSISKTADGYEASGELSLKGSTKPATMTFTFEDMGATAKFMGNLTLDRFDFNVGEGWNDTSWVGQNVEVAINLDLTQ
jgi:polyisoprenoid-binding protein YceI